MVQGIVIGPVATDIKDFVTLFYMLSHCHVKPEELVSEVYQGSNLVSVLWLQKS